MTKRTCISCGTIFEDHLAYFKCSTCQQTEKMSKLYKEQNRLIEEQNRIARQQQAAQAYYAANPSPVYYSSPEPEPESQPQSQPQMKRWDTSAVTTPKKYSILDHFISRCLIFINWLVSIVIFFSLSILGILAGWIIWTLTGKLLWLLALIPVWFILLIPMSVWFRSLHVKCQDSIRYYLSKVPDKNHCVKCNILFYDTWDWS